MLPSLVLAQWPEDSDLPPATGYTEEFPVEFSRASRALLERSGIFTLEQIDTLIAYRNKYGSFLSRYELQVIPGITIEQLNRVDLFFTFREGLLSAADIEIRKKNTNGFLLMQTSIRNTDGFRYRGRVEIRKRQWYLGIRFDQDYREHWRWEPRKSIWGVDHVSGTIQWIGFGRVKSVTLGEFRLQSGEGLVHAGRFFLGKGSLPPLPAARIAVLGRPTYNENLTRKGLSIEMELMNWKTIVYGSKSREDVHLYEDGSFRSISSSGIHTTTSEQKKHNRLGHTSFGFLTERQFQKASIGFTINSNHFSAPYLPVRDYQQELPRGARLGQASIFAKWSWRSTLIWSEHAFSFNGRRASLLGMGLGLGRYMTVYGILREYRPGYITFFGRGFSENSNGQRNEQGIYMGLSWKRKKVGEIFGYIDIYRFPERSYRHDPNVHGIDIRIRGERIINNWRIRYTTKWEKRDQSPGNPALSLWVYKQQIYAVRDVTSGSLIIRAQMNFRKEGSLLNGKLLSLERRWKERNLQWSVVGSFFKTDGYYTREFIYERDVWGTFSLPSYFGTGVRGLVYFKWTARPFTVWLRAGMVIRKETPSSKEIKVQLKYQF